MDFKLCNKYIAYEIYVIYCYINFVSVSEFLGALMQGSFLIFINNLLKMLKTCLSWENKLLDEFKHFSNVKKRIMENKALLEVVVKFLTDSKLTVSFFK